MLSITTTKSAVNSNGAKPSTNIEYSNGAAPNGNHAASNASASVAPYNPDTIRQFLGSLQHGTVGGITEIRILTKDANLSIEGRKTFVGKTVVGYYESDQHDKAARDIAPFDGQAQIYAGLNPVHPDLLARAANRLQPNAKNTATDADILCRMWLPVDTDAVRPSGISATDSELAAAIERRNACADELQSYGAQVIRGMSGNGGHLLVRLPDIPNTEESRAKIERVLKSLSSTHSNDAVNVDTSVCNAARIWKLYGTLAVKGDSISTRPHRRATIELPDDAPRPFDLEQFPTTEPEAPANTQTPIATNGTGNHTNSAYIRAALFGKLNDARAKMEAAQDNQRHDVRLDLAHLLGGFLHYGVFSEADAVNAIAVNFGDSESNARKTIADGLKNGAKKPLTVMPPEPQHKTAKLSSTRHDASGNGEGDSRPRINADEADAKEFSPRCWEALRTANEKSPRIFLMGGALYRLQIENGAPSLRELTRERLSFEMARTALFFKTRTKGKGENAFEVEELIHPPKQYIEDMLADHAPPMPTLRRIVAAPVFAADGTLQTTRGYHSASQTYYHPPRRLNIPRVSPNPTQADIQNARALIEQAIAEFPFVSQADKANAIVAGLLTYGRDLIDGPTPLHDFEATGPGTGKGLLVDALMTPPLGGAPAVMTQWKDEDECRKRITSMAREGKAAALLDNLTKPLNSGTFAGAITATSWADRILGKNETVTIPLRCVWLLTANNPVMSTEIARRCIRIRLDAKCERAWQRTGFEIGDLRTWVNEHCGELIAANLTLIQAWIAAGKPDGGKRLGSFEAWASVMSGILQVAGIEGFLDNLEDFYDRADAEGAAWRSFIQAWWDKHNDRTVKASELYELANETEGFPIYGKTERGQRTSFGTLLQQKRDSIIGGFQIVYAGEGAARAKLWQLKPTGKIPISEPCEPSEPFRDILSHEGRLEEHINNGTASEGSQGSQGSLTSPTDETAAESEVLE